MNNQLIKLAVAFITTKGNSRQSMLIMEVKVSPVNPRDNRNSAQMAASHYYRIRQVKAQSVDYRG
jgi:Fe-S cluster biosynthesis and repair protein YggX